MKKAVIWNSASGLINAAQSAIILIFISRFLDVQAAGIFTIAYAISNLVYSVTKYGVRNFQVTDVAGKYPFSAYLNMRWILVGITVLASVVYLLFTHFVSGDSATKVFVVFAIILWKMVDAVEDVYYGMYQQRGRLDIGAKYYTYRILFSTIVYCVLIVAGMSLLNATLIVVAFSIVSAAVFIRKSYPIVVVDREDSKRNNLKKDAAFIKKLFVECFSLCVGAALSIYIGNAPKYMIDQCMDERTQGYFGILIMPAFVIMILNNFIYQPIIRQLGQLWNEKRYDVFLKRVLMQYIIVFGITVVVVIGGAWIGLPVLSWIYGIDLISFRTCFILLLVGGGVYALVSFIMVPLTTMRFQNCISFGFGGVTIVTLLCGKWMVYRWGIIGASILYVSINFLLVIYLTLCFFYKLWKERKSEIEL